MAAPSAPTSLGTLVVYITGNASQYNRFLKSVTVDTETAMETAVRSAKYAAVAITGALAAIGGFAVREFAKLDDALTKSMAIMGEVSQGVRNEMERNARDIAISSVTAADEVAKGYQALASAGLDAKQSIAALGITERFAVAGQMSLNKSAETLTDTVSSLGLASKDAVQYQTNITRVADVLAKGANISQASVEQLADALQGKVAGSLRLVNKEVEEGVAVLGAFAAAGIKGLDANEKMNQLLRDLQVSFNDNRLVWQRFGLQIYDTQGRMLHMADIIEQLENRLGSMSDEQKRLTLTTLGFQDRTVGATTAILGMSNMIRDYEAQLKQAKGTTEEMWKIQMSSFSAEVTNLWNRIKEAALIIGEQLVPVIRTLSEVMGISTFQIAELNQKLKDGTITLDEYKAGMELANQSNADFARTASTVGQIISTALIVITGVVGDVIAGFKLITKGGEVALIAATSVITHLVVAAMKGIQWLVSKTTDGLNMLIRAYNKVAAKVSDGIQLPELKFGGFDFLKLWELQAEGVNEALAAAGKEFGELVDQGRPSDKILQQLDAMNQKILDMGDPAKRNKIEEIDKALQRFYGGMDKGAMQANAVEAALNSFFGSIDIGANKITPQLVELEGLLRDPLGTVYQESVSKLDTVMRQGLLSADAYNAALRQLTSAQNPFIKPDTKLMNPTGDANVDAFVDNNNELVMLENSFQKKLDATNQYYNEQKMLHQENAAEMERLEAVRLQTLMEMDQNMAAQRLVLEQQKNALIMGSFQSISDSMVSMAKDAAGEQSGVYKAMFAASKAFAIADAIVKIQQGIANALSLPWPLNLAAAASTAAAAASIVSSISAVALSFEGGGYTGNGPRSGGLDGKGGYMAMVHPREVIIDLNMAGAREKEMLNSVDYPRVATTARQQAARLKAAGQSYAGGGHTGSGMRSGGLDGIGGFPAILHPRERIVDEMQDDEKSDSKGGGVLVSVNQTFTGGVTREDLAASAKATERRTVAAIMDGISRGGNMRKAIHR